MPPVFLGDVERKRRSCWSWYFMGERGYWSPAWLLRDVSSGRGCSGWLALSRNTGVDI